MWRCLSWIRPNESDVFIWLYIYSSIETGQPVGFLPPFLPHVWTNSASERRGAERHLWSTFYWYVCLFGRFYSHLKAFGQLLGYSISMIVYGCTLFRCVQSQNSWSSTPCLISNHDLETYVYFSQNDHDHYVIRWTVSSTFGVCTWPMINDWSWICFLGQSSMVGVGFRCPHSTDFFPEAYWITLILA